MCINMRNILTSQKTMLNIRKMLAWYYVLSTLLYASGNWVLNQNTIQKLEAFEIFIYHYMFKISHEQHTSNDKVLKMGREKGSLIWNIKYCQIVYFGHVIMRMQLLEWRSKGNEVKGNSEENAAVISDTVWKWTFWTEFGWWIVEESAESRHSTA